MPADSTALGQIDRFASEAGFPFPEDLRCFYGHFESACISGRYQLLPIAQWKRTGAALQGDDWADSEPPSWYAFCDAFNGDFMGIDLEQGTSGSNAILDCDHEDIGQRAVIADSFSEFLYLALDESRLAFTRLRTLEVPYNPPVAWLRRQYARWSQDPEVGPELCKHPGCSRSRVSLSVHCRRHHFEAINHLPYPFDD